MIRHHAYFYAGDIEEGVGAALSFGERELGLSGSAHADIITLQYTLFSVDEARQVSQIASRTPLRGAEKLIVIAAPRLFHEAQNALLKVFEEPPPGTYLVLVVPSEGSLIPTLRSRILPLPTNGKREEHAAVGEVFLKAGKSEREKIIEKILERARSDKPEEKQAARTEALHFAESLTRAAFLIRGKQPTPELTALLQDLTRLIPILHERSAPLKPILEHLLISTPH